MIDKYTGLHCILASSNEIDYEIIVLKIERLEPIQVNQRIYHKCDMVIQNIRLSLLHNKILNYFGCLLYLYEEEANITLWLDIAHSFFSLSLETLAQPTIADFTSLKVKLFLENIVLNNTSSTLFFIDPDIPELNSYKSV
ncbi:hypothetical protein D8674_018006 [Pyrus ussuriensis x Pyrus communis]|uniref:Uncharacterized protein n=1 Tax=Pyrus ussuriensis x Pyrus communis TaxID=2448454 RepID=A0A5N5HEB0_9ROSA|nr:hypothetical protein D8674_018006 [Pyrus ussuriensis x Pyrus communis]